MSDQALPPAPAPPEPPVSDPAILGRAAAWLAEGQGVALATVIQTWGSAPRPAGSLLAVNAAGAFEGSVSGGCVEGAVVEAGLQVIRTGVARRLTFGVSDERAWSLGLACGGTIEVAVARVPRPDTLAPLLADLEARRPVVVAMDLALGTFDRLYPEDPAPAADPRLELARQAARRGRSILVGPAGAAPPEGTAGLVGLGRPAADAAPAVFLRVFAPPVRVVLVGAVHIAQALAPMVRLAGYDAVVVDPRPSFAAPARFPGCQVLAAWPEPALARLGADRHTAVVALSHDPKIDDPALAAGLRAGAFYVGALGSRGSHAARRARLLALGLSQAALDRICGPVGLPIGAESPGEIAAAILAELVAHLRRPPAA